MPAAWSPSEAALESHHECTRSKVGTRPDIALDVARTKNQQQQQNKPGLVMVHGHIHNGDTRVADSFLYVKAAGLSVAPPRSAQVN